jgi:hypothetical protein
MSENPVQHKPWTPEWVNQVLRSLDLPMAVGYLRAWIPEKQQKEASEGTVMAIQQLTHDNTIRAIKGLKSNKIFVRGMKG